MKVEAWFTHEGELWVHLGPMKVKRCDAHRLAEKLLRADPDRFGVRLQVQRGNDKPLLEFTAIRSLRAGR